MTESKEFTEAERIEIGRRTSEMNSIIKLAAIVFNQEDALKEAMLEAERGTKSYWLWGICIIGLIVDYHLRETTFDLNFGTYIWIMVGIILIAYNFKLSQLKREFRRTREKLFDLDRLWFAAVGADTFWQTKPYFEDLSSFDYELMSEKSLEWRREQWGNIVNSVRD